MNSAVFKMLLVLSFIPVTVNAESSPIDASIQNALPYIQQEAQTWIDQKKCVSCHQVPFGLWSTHVAKNAGFQIDKELFETQTKWSLQFCDTNVTDKTKKRDGGGTDTTYQIILSGVSASDATVTTSLANLLTTFQKADGSFKPGGQLPGQKRPLLETTHVSTAWAALMFHDLALDEHQKTLDKAVKFTLGDFTGQTTEWMAVRALLEQEFGGQQES
ncbi:MAG: hypothetical protein VX738_14220, partial [Planctomycetota bacterium]|nr:hypothetical protein [Planctomycetota bacterium]